MDDGSAPATDLDDAFSVLADETRLEILQALWESEAGSVRFSTLRKAVGMRDSGNFSYHLDELIPQFVRATNEEYELTFAGRHVVGAAIAGTYTDAATTSPEPIQIGSCFSCGAPLDGEYEDGFFQFTCTECGEINEVVGAPPIVVAGHDDTALTRTLSQYMLSKVQKRARGFCLLCNGPMAASLPALSDHEQQLPDEYVEVRYECRACGNVNHAGVASVALDHPAVISFLYDRGIDLHDTSLYDRADLLAFDGEITSEDPVRVSVTYELDGDTLELTLDESLSVIDHTPV